MSALAQNGHEDDTERYGGYSSWCAITRFPKEIVAAAAPICSVTDLVVDYQTTRPDIRRYRADLEVPRFFRCAPRARRARVRCAACFARLPQIAMLHHLRASPRVRSRKNSVHVGQPHAFT